MHSTALPCALSAERPMPSPLAWLQLAWRGSAHVSCCWPWLPEKFANHSFQQFFNDLVHFLLVTMDSDDDFRDFGNKKNECYNFPAVTSDVPAKYLETKRGKQCLVDPYNYTYHKNRDYKGQTFWRCVRERSTVLPRYLDE
jgi:hypothetical protein